MSPAASKPRSISIHFTFKHHAVCCALQPFPTTKGGKTTICTNVKMRNLFQQSPSSQEPHPCPCHCSCSTVHKGNSYFHWVFSHDFFPKKFLQEALKYFKPAEPQLFLNYYSTVTAKFPHCFQVHQQEGLLAISERLMWIFQLIYHGWFRSKALSKTPSLPLHLSQEVWQKDKIWKSQPQNIETSNKSLLWNPALFCL